MNKNHYPECPADELLQEIAAGIAPGETVAQNAPHIVSCDFCGPLLKQYIHEFSDELSAEDTAILGQLKSSSPKWQKKLVREHVVSKNAAEGDQKSVWEKMKESFSWPQLAGAAAVAAVIVVAVIALARGSGDDPDRLVASAYAERRTIEMRLSSVPYSQYRPFKTTLGSEGEQGAGFDRPNLSAAKAEVGKKLKSGTADPKLLEAEGRIALLDGSGTAINTAKSALENARDAGLETPKLQIDLAATYFESEMKNHPGQPDLRKSMDLLKAVVDDPKLKPKDESRLSALFDLALTYEKSNQLDLARRTWEEYLQLDSNSDWAKEARAHRDRLPQSAGQPVSRRDDPFVFLKDPAAKQSAEEYMDAALIDWLPKALKEPGSNYPQALEHLADLMVTEHSDFWLKDFWSRVQPGDVQAIEELSAAVLANQQDRTTDALAHARVAATGFAKRNNIPGELRAHFEEVYAYQRQLDGSACRTRAGPLAIRLADAKYPWLQSQTALETAICLNFLGNYSTLDNEIEISRKVAADAHLSSLLLRTLGVAAGIHRQTEKKCDKAWRDGVQGLEEYWKGTHRPENLFQFYSVLGQCAEQSDQYYVAKALLQQAITIREGIAAQNHNLDDAVVRSTLYVHLANIFEALGESAQAEEEVKKADSLLEGEKEQYTTVAFRLAAKIRLADIQSKRGKPETAMSTLQPVRELLATTDDQFFAVNFYRVLGDIHLHLRNLGAASSAYEEGIVIAENSLSTLKDPFKRLQWSVKTEDLYKGLTRVLLEQHSPEDAWKLWEWYKGRSMLGQDSRMPLAGKRTWKSLQEQIFLPALPRLTTRVVYVTYEDGVQIWVVSELGIKSHWIPVAQHDVEKLTKRFVEVCGTSSSNLDEVHSLAQKLYMLLFAPISKDLHQQTVSIELDRSLQNMLIEALRSPEGYLAQRFQFLYSPGVLVESSLRKPMRSYDQATLLQLDGSGYVPNRESFRARISGFFPKTRILEGLKSNLPEIQAALSTSDIFNFIGHGKESGSKAALQVRDQPDELLLQAGDIPSSLHRLTLATLSACSTGTSDDNGLLDTGNLANSFLAAGVPTVVASRWNVVSDSTQRLIGSFYSNVRHGDTAASALQKAQKELLITQDHPYYWAGFYLAGRAN